MSEAFDRNLTQLIEAIKDCVEQERILPALVLLYTGIDVVASLERSSNEGTQKAFRRWAETYMLSSGNLPCDSADLYGARCGVLHTFSADSDLQRAGSARQVIYAWGPQTADNLQQATDRLGRPYLAVRLNDLIGAFVAGLDRYRHDLQADHAREEAAMKAAGLWLINLEPGLLRLFLDTSS